MTILTEEELIKVIGFVEDEMDYIEGLIREEAEKCAREKIKEEIDRDVIYMEKNKWDEKHAIHVNLISVKEMLEHRKEMTEQMDSKFIKCLVATGMTYHQAYKEVEKWNAKRGY